MAGVINSIKSGQLKDG